MPNDVTFWEFTAQGVQAVRDSPEHVDRIEELFDEMGGQLEECYVLMGRYDTITISEFLDEKTAARGGTRGHRKG